MEYEDEVVSRIALSYAKLINSIDIINRSESFGLTLANASKAYIDAARAVRFLSDIPDPIKNRLKIEKLEEEVTKLGESDVDIF